MPFPMGILCCCITPSSSSPSSSSCENCPQYEVSVDIWTYLISGLTLGSYTFVSSTTGNPVHTDLNMLGTTNFTFQTIFPLGGGTIDAYSGILSPFPGETWTYVDPDDNLVTFEQLRIDIDVIDHCSKAYAGVAISLIPGISPRVTYALFLGTEPALENCGLNIVQAKTSASNILFGIGGLIILDPP